ncbi:HNH endonuclease [Ancylobacter aquaticus]|nr:HNH endonuclease [Ancylobacter aquaticus]
MDERLERIIRNTASFEELAQFEANARERHALTDEMQEAIRKRSGELGRHLIAKRTGLRLVDLSPAEERIVEAVSEYVGVMKRQGKDATRTLGQLRNQGLIHAAEVAVAQAKPTQGFQTLSDVGREDLSYEQIILDHEEEFSPRAIWYSRRTLSLPNDSPTPPTQRSSLTQGWSEALVSWLERRALANGGKIPHFTNADSAAALGMPDLLTHGRVLGNVQSRIDFACYRLGLPPLGLAAEAPFDRAWGREDRDWDFPVAQMQAAAQSRLWERDEFSAIRSETKTLSGRAHIPWRKELTTDEAKVKAWAFGLQASEAQTLPSKQGDEQDSAADAAEAPYWVLVCNPKKWAIDRFFELHVSEDSWGVRPSDRARFRPGQLAVVRVGTDRRTAAELGGRQPLAPGIYALCEINSVAFSGTGASDEFWAEGEGREPGWPTVKIGYLRTYLDKPLTIERLRTEAPHLSRMLLDGHQAASFPISAEDFRTILSFLREDADELPSLVPERDLDIAELAALEEKYLSASPEVKERLSKSVERGSIGALVKKATGYKCQVCEALGLNPVGFLKRDGHPYVEAHHVMPVARMQIGSLAVSNVMTVCANHHRQLHYGGIDVTISEQTFDLAIDGKSLRIRRLTLDRLRQDRP